MKKIFISIAILATSVAVIIPTTQSCTALATSDIGMAVIKRVLTDGVDKTADIYKNKESFLKNDLIINALPENLRGIYNTLDKVAPNLTQKGRESVADAAAYTVNVSTPILNNAINNLNTDDVTRIIQGQKGIATQILREKTEQQIAQAILPKVDEKLNELGIIKTLNTALKGNNLLGSLLGGGKSGNSNTSISQLASEQITKGMFNIIEDYEVQNQNTLLGAFKGK